MMAQPVPDNWCVEDNWVIDDNKIRLYLENMYENEYSYVSKNRSRYPECVQSIIKEYDGQPLQKLAKGSKLKIKELTEYDEFVMNQNAKKQLMSNIDQKWQEYKTTHLLKRPTETIDRLYDIFYNRLQVKREEFKKLCESTPIKLYKSYVPPSKRVAAAAEDPKMIPFRKEIETMEKELEELKKKVSQEDDEWEQTEKYNFAREQQHM
jgi:hypothetical protein